MKHLYKLFTLLVVALFVCTFTSCSSDDEEMEEPSMEVTPANLHGTWKLVEWNNGEQVPEGTYCYIVFDRREQTYVMYQKFDSMYGRRITGSFAIKNDPYQGYVISGTYDYNRGDPPRAVRLNGVDRQGRHSRREPLRALRRSASRNHQRVERPDRVIGGYGVLAVACAIKRVKNSE